MFGGLSALVCAILLFFQFGHAETTNGQMYVYQDENGQWRYTYQRRDNPQGVGTVIENDGAVVAQREGTYYRGPTSGPRTSAITSRGGDAAQQICGGPLEITNMNGQCRELEYDQDFLQVVQTEGLACARSAAQEAFGFTPSRVRLRTGEGQVSSGRYSSNGKVSTHAIGRALDIFNIELYNGAAHNTVTMHGAYMDRQGHRTFYSNMYDCWEGVVDTMQAQGISGSCGSGCLGFEDNSAHWDHMHMSLPPTQAVRSQHRVNCT